MALEAGVLKFALGCEALRMTDGTLQFDLIVSVGGRAGKEHFFGGFLACHLVRESKDRSEGQYGPNSPGKTMADPASGKWVR